ncbi:hypothetical protein Pelo_11596 [Pelomyxa schiedti]|nr:hypothetical protein Pelo_11596 [Pelomyxa schiedti]
MESLTPQGTTPSTHAITQEHPRVQMNALSCSHIVPYTPTHGGCKNKMLLFEDKIPTSHPIFIPNTKNSSATKNNKLVIFCSHNSHPAKRCFYSTPEPRRNLTF